MCKDATLQRGYQFIRDRKIGCAPTISTLGKSGHRAPHWSLILCAAGFLVQSLELFHLSLKSGQTADNRFSCCRTSPTTDCISSPPWTLFAKNLNRSAVRRNCFSQLRVKPDPLDILGCGPASFALPASCDFSALFVLSTTGAFSSKATRGLFSIGSCCLPGVENQR